MKARFSHHSRLKASYGCFTYGFLSLSAAPNCTENHIQSPMCSLEENADVSVAFLKRLLRQCSCFLWQSSQRNPKHQAKTEKSDSSEAKQCKQLHRNIRGDYYKIFWTKNSTIPDKKVDYPKSKRLCKTNNKQKTKNYPKTKTCNESDCMGRKADHFLIWGAPMQSLVLMHLFQEARAMSWPSETSYLWKPNFSW